MLKRTNKPEWIDLGSEYYTPQEYRDCLGKLGKIGSWLGGNQATLEAIEKACPDPKSIVDVGCGGGALTRIIAAKYPQARVVGIDTSKEAIAYAKERNGNLPNLSFQNTRSLDGPYDIVTATLVCHHMQDHELVGFFQEAQKNALFAVVINDLHRNPLAWLGFAAISPVLFPNRLIFHDGLLSIRKGFQKQEFISLLAQAGIKNYQIDWKWAFRWIVTLYVS